MSYKYSEFHGKNSYKYPGKETLLSHSTEYTLEFIFPLWCWIFSGSCEHEKCSFWYRLSEKNRSYQECDL